MDVVNISGKMTDMDFIIHVLGNLPEEYEIAVESLEDQLEDTTNKLGVEEVCTKLNARFAIINRQDKMKTSWDSKLWRGNSHLARIAGSMDILTGNVLKSPRTA